MERLVHRQRSTVGLEVQALRLDVLGQCDLTLGDFDRQVVGHDLVGLLQELGVILLGVFGQMLVGTVGGLPAVLAGGHVLHDLGDLRGRNADAVRRTHRGVAQGEAVGEHIPIVRQRAVGLCGERRVIGIMEVNVALHMRVRHGIRQHGEGGCLGDGSGQQVTLGGVHVGILVGVLTHQGFVTIHQSAYCLVDIGGLGAFDILVQTIVGVGAGHVVQVILDQAMLHKILDVLDFGRTVVAFLDLSLDLVGDTTDHLLFLRADLLVEIGEGGLHRADDVDRIEIDHTTIALLDEHFLRSGCGGRVHRAQNLSFHFSSFPSRAFRLVSMLRIACPVYIGFKYSTSSPALYLVEARRHRN